MSPFDPWDDADLDDADDFDAEDADEPDLDDDPDHDFDEDDEDLDDAPDDDFDPDDEDAAADDDLENEDLDVEDLGLDEDFDEADFDSALAGSVDVMCPYCGESVELVVDPMGGDEQEYVEDCEVCCRPWSVRVTVDPDSGVSVDVGTLDAG